MKKIELITFFTFLINQPIISQNPCGGIDLLTVNDTIICGSEILLISALPGYDNYSWSTGSEDQSTSISEPGIYTVNATLRTNNLVTNGSFNSGNTGFSSTYSYNPVSLINEGTYAITTDATNVHPDFYGTGDGNFMVVNGSTTPGVKIWCQDVIVEPETTYNFSTLVTSIVNINPNLAVLQFSINGEEIGESFTSPGAGIWNEFNAIWFSGSETVAEICIENRNITSGGNDFGLDDITFTTLCAFSENITVQLFTNVTISEVDELCELGQPIELQATDDGGIWSGNGIIDAHMGLFDPSVAGDGDHRVVYTIGGPCSDEDEHYIHVKPAPNANFNHTILLEDPCEIALYFSSENDSASSYHWEFNNGATSNEKNSIQYFDLNQPTYEITLKTENDFYCVNSSSQTIKMPELSLVYVPNVFTPDGNGNNDLFHAYSECVEDIKFSIYDRWGKLVFHSKNISVGWDGYYEGTLLNNGTYTWYLTYLYKNKIRKKNGYVLLLK